MGVVSQGIALQCVSIVHVVCDVRMLACFDACHTVCLGLPSWLVDVTRERGPHSVLLVPA